MASHHTVYHYVAEAPGLTGTRAEASTGEPAAKPASTGGSGCDVLPPVGVWQQITPAGASVATFGIVNVHVVANNSATVYVGTAESGIFKSTDCGAKFVKINTGSLGSSITPGGTNPMPDPVTPNVVYTFSLYGMNGFFKSTDGGVNFKQILTHNITQYAPHGGFTGSYDMDPQDHLHLLVSWHDACASPYYASCFAETFDGGATWKMRNGLQSWSGGEGTSLSFLDSNRWLFSSSTNGLWLTKDQGQTWSQIPNAQVAHGSGQLVRTADGAFFMAGANGILVSPDGESWQLMPNTGYLKMGLATDGTTVWTSVAYPYNPTQRPAPEQRYFQAQAANPGTWTPMRGAPLLSSGGCWLAYDADHHILYSANYYDGLWRVVIK